MKVPFKELNKYIRTVSFQMAGRYGIDTPESRKKQASFIRELREAAYEEGLYGNR